MTKKTKAWLFETSKNGLFLRQGNTMIFVTKAMLEFCMEHIKAGDGAIIDNGSHQVVGTIDTHFIDVRGNLVNKGIAE